MIDLRRRTRASACATLACLHQLRLTSSHRLWIRGRLRAVLALGVLALTLSVGVPTAHAAIITVNTTVDELNTDGDCSLREAIQAANTDAPVDTCLPGTGADVIVVPSGNYTMSLAGTNEDANATGDFDIVSDIVFSGSPGTVVDGAGFDRVFHFIAGTVTVVDIGVRGGGVPGETCEGGGIYNRTTLTLSRVAVFQNFAGAGGGINNAGTLTIDDSRISDNRSRKRGGGIENSTTLIINNSTVSGNQNPFGAGSAFDPPCVGLAFFGAGGIFNDGAVTLNNSTISGNFAWPNAGGIFNFSGNLTVNSSTVSRNSADSAGGGIANRNTATIQNSTISGNSAIQGGGGINNFAGTLMLDSSTLSENGSNFGTGGIRNSTGIVELGNTILANSTSGGDCSGSVLTSTGYNLIEDTSGCTILGDIATNITGVDPVLGPLVNNGGPTETHALLLGSPAIDAGRIACPPPAMDQRGVLRPQGPRCDIGAFELQVAGPGPPAFLTLEPAADTNEVGTEHCVTATVTDANGMPVPDVTVRFSVTGANNTSGSATTDANGEARFCYTGMVAGTDTIRAFADSNGDGFQDPNEPFDVATKIWTCPPGEDDLDDDGLDDKSEDLFGNLLNDVDSDDDGIRDGNDDGDDDGEDDEDEDDGTDQCPEDGDDDGVDDEDEDDEEDDD